MKISTTPVDAGGLATERVEIRRVTIRDTPPEPFVTETAQELGGYKAVLDTSEGPITIEFFTDKAPDTVRQFMRMAAAGVYNGMAFHRVAPGFVIQTGAEGTPRLRVHGEAAAAGPAARPGVQRHEAREGDCVDGPRRGAGKRDDVVLHLHRTSTALDGQYTAFGRVIDGMAAVEAIEKAPRNDETPIARIDLRTIRIEKK